VAFQSPGSGQEFAAVRVYLAAPIPGIDRIFDE